MRPARLRRGPGSGKQWRLSSRPCERNVGDEQSVWRLRSSFGGERRRDGQGLQEAGAFTGTCRGCPTRAPCTRHCVAGDPRHRSFNNDPVGVPAFQAGLVAAFDAAAVSSVAHVSLDQAAIASEGVSQSWGQGRRGSRGAACKRFGCARCAMTCGRRVGWAQAQRES